MTLSFYKDLEVVPSFLDAFHDKYYKDVPADWWVALTDIKGSTQLIGEGRYKDVNVAGGLAAMAVANVMRDLEYPYIFGGDGMTFLVPGTFEPEIRAVLWDTRQKVKELYGMELRVGLVPLSDLYEMGHQIQVAKLKQSEFHTQTMMIGDGIDVAEEWLKSPKAGQDYLLHTPPPVQREADFTGFTCRWKDVKSEQGETIALIVRERTSKTKLTGTVQKVIEKIYGIYGDESAHHPIRESSLQSVTTAAQMSNEARARSLQKSGSAYQRELLKIRLQVWIVRLSILLRLPLRSGYLELRNIKKNNVSASDFKKYDGSLKMVISGTREQRLRLVAFLEELYRAGEIFYGIHVSDRALLTCLLHQESELETHFVDAADGGYALAARQLKEQIRLAAERSSP